MCNLLYSSVVITTWEIVKNAESQALPDLLYQNLLFNKIPHMIYVHT